MLISFKRQREIKALVKRYRTMILTNSLFFYFGCAVTLSVMKMECADATNKAEREPESPDFSKVEYAVMILSAPDNIIRRNAIRATWMHLRANIFSENGERMHKWNYNISRDSGIQDFISVAFVIATKDLDEDKVRELISEQGKYNDLMLLPDVRDGYTSLSEKMLLAFKLFNKYKHLKYVIKCDDDSFVRLDLIIKELDAFLPTYYAPEQNAYVSYKKIQKSQPMSKGVYWGYFNGRAKVYLSGKWQEQDWFLCDNYLPYALGGGYVVSKSIVEYLDRNSEFLSKYNSEDVSMGVWTAALDGINRIHDTRFDTEWKSRGCSDNMLVRHKQTPEDMYKMFKSLIHSNGRKLCSSQTIARKSYLYKWDVLPSQCCR